MKNRLFITDENSTLHQFDFKTEDDATRCGNLFNIYMAQNRKLKDLAKKLSDALAFGSGKCDYDIVQKEENGVMLQGTTHKDNCQRCDVLREYNEMQKGT